MRGFQNTRLYWPLAWQRNLNLLSMQQRFFVQGRRHWQKLYRPIADPNPNGASLGIPHFFKSRLDGGQQNQPRAAFFKIPDRN